MSRKTLTVLWLLAIVIGAAQLYLAGKKDVAPTKTTLAQGDQVVPQDQLRQAQVVSFENGEKAVTLKKKDDTWTVAEKGGFPADLEKLRRATDALSGENMKIVRGIPAEEKYLDRFGLKTEEGQKEPPRKVTIAKEDGTALRTVLVGKRSEGTGAAGPGGKSARFVRLAEDQSGVYVVSEDFFFLDADPANWIDKTFVSLQNPTKISVESAKAEKKDSWTVTRPDASANFELEGLGPDRQTVFLAAAPLKNLFTGGSFLELLTAEDAKARAAEGESRTATVTTDLGATYHFQLTPEKKDAPETPEETPNPVETDDRNYFVTIKAVKSPTSPAKPGEKATDEEKKIYATKAQSFETASKRFEKNKRLEGYTFLVSNQTVKPLLVTRDDLEQEKPKPPAPPKPVPPVEPAVPVTPNKPAPAPAAPLKTGPSVTATTPPIEVKPAPPAKPAEAPKPADAPKVEPTQPVAPAAPVVPVPATPKEKLVPQKPGETPKQEETPEPADTPKVKPTQPTAPAAAPVVPVPPTPKEAPKPKPAAPAAPKAPVPPKAPTQPAAPANPQPPAVAPATPAPAPAPATPPKPAPAAPKQPTPKPATPPTAPAPSTPKPPAPAQPEQPVKPEPPKAPATPTPQPVVPVQPKAEPTPTPKPSPTPPRPHPAPSTPEPTAPKPKAGSKPQPSKPAATPPKPKPDAPKPAEVPKKPKPAPAPDPDPFLGN